MTSPLLLQPLPLRQREARNRLWMAPMCMYSVNAQDGRPTDFHVIHYGSRAQGGFGTVVVEATAVTPNGRLSLHDLGLWEDAQIAGQRRIVEAIHAGGALAGIQLSHGGRKAGTPPWRPASPSSPAPSGRRATVEGWDLVGPSALAYPNHAVPRALTVAEIEQIIADFAQAAARAVAAGYDLVEIHAAHGYLLHQFLSPLSNTRTDAYGGDTQGRRRVVSEVVQAIRAAVPDETILGIRLSATDWADGGLTSDDTAALSRDLVTLGVDALHISTSGNVPAPLPIGPGYQVRFAADVARAVEGMTTPGGCAPAIVAVGLITTGPQAEQILRSGQASAVALGRYALRDPYAPLRWAHELGVNAWDEAGFPLPYWRGAWN